MKLEYLYWALNTTAGVSSEHLDYTRNQTTQNKSRTICSLYPSFTFKILPTKKAGEQLEFQLMYEQSASSIFDMLDYTDDAVPQIVKLGNPNLKGYASSTFNVNFTDRESKRRQQYNLNGNFRYYHRQVAQSVVYNPTNSQYLRGKLIASVAVRGFCPVGGRCDFIVNGAGHWSLCATAHYDYFCKTAIIGKSLS